MFVTVNVENTMAYCNGLKGLLLAMKIEYIAKDWRLFVDGSSSSLKAVLLHNTNQRPPIMLYYSTVEKENRASMQKVIDIIKYNEHKWKICCDLKVVALLCNVKPGRPNYACFKCNWNCRDKLKQQYTSKGYTNPNPDIKGSTP